jgi:hypothetical protein
MKLHRRPTFQEMAGLINNPDFKINYPNRFYSRLAKTPDMSQFYGNMEGIMELQDQQSQILKQQIFELNMKKVASETSTPYNHLLAQSRTSTTPVVEMPMSDDEFLDDMTEEEQRRASLESKRKQAIKDALIAHLNATHLQNLQHIPEHLRPDMDTDTEDEPGAEPRGRGRPLLPKGVLKDPITKKTSTKGTKLKKQAEPMVVDDEEMPQKRPTKKEMKEMKRKTVDTMLKVERDGKKKRQQAIKQEGASSSGQVQQIAEPKRRGRPTPNLEADDEVKIGNVLLDKTTKPENMSAKEMRNQLNLRFPGKLGDWAFKTRQQLITIIKGMIANGTW